MNEASVLSYVEAAAALRGVPLDADRAQRVSAHLQRTAGMAALLEGAPMAAHDELAEIFSPAAFPPPPDGHGLL
jgi:hypothetical protein